MTGRARGGRHEEDSSESHGELAPPVVGVAADVPQRRGRRDHRDNDPKWRSATGAKCSPTISSTYLDKSHTLLFSHYFFCGIELTLATVPQGRGQCCWPTGRDCRCGESTGRYHRAGSRRPRVPIRFASPSVPGRHIQPATGRNPSQQTVCLEPPVTQPQEPAKRQRLPYGPAGTPGRPFT